MRLFLHHDWADKAVLTAVCLWMFFTGNIGWSVLCSMPFIFTADDFVADFLERWQPGFQRETR